MRLESTIKQAVPCQAHLSYPQTVTPGDRSYERGFSGSKVDPVEQRFEDVGVRLDEVGAVGVRKGCYVGQEVVSRMQHRGTARRRVLIVNGDGDLPAPGTDIAAGGRSIGTLGSTAGRSGLAIVRIDRAKDAMDAGTAITAGETAVTLRIPAFAKFTYPVSAAEGEG